MGYCVNFEFLDDDAIENVVTCLNYRMDKVIFFGEKEMIAEKKKELTYFLTECCGVGQKARLTKEAAVQFVEISATDLEDVIAKIKSAILLEREEHSQIFIDITGGEGLTLLAFGILAKELGEPMHLYDIETGELREYSRDEEKKLSKVGTLCKVEWNIDTFAKMQGGEVNESRNKSHKAYHSEEDIKDIEELWKLLVLYKVYWNNFTGILAQLHNPERKLNSSWDKEGLTFEGSTNAVETVIKDHRGFAVSMEEDNCKRSVFEQFNVIMKACMEKGFLEEFSYTAYQYSYKYKNDFIRNCLTESGSVLEQHVYTKVCDMEGITDCRVGVHINWNLPEEEEAEKQNQKPHLKNYKNKWKKKHRNTNNDSDTEVLNEVDVLALKGYIPVFISCKATKIANLNQNMLYELDTVANRFGGKYAKRVLALVEKWEECGHRDRAEEMEIEIWEEIE